MRYPTLAMLTSFVLLISVASAQNPSGSSSDRTVSGTGTTAVKKMPTTMRMTILFKESGKTMPDALKNLKDRRAAAKAVFVKLGAKNDSIREGAPSVAGEDPQAAQMAAMMAARQGGSKKKKSSAAKVTVAGNLSGEWPLPNGSTEELLLFVQDLKDRVQAADIGGQKEKKKLSAEEQEEMEEMEMVHQQFGNRPEAKPGEPTHLFFAKISAEEQQTAKAAAFQKARRQAEQLATAAGGKLGKLRSLHSTSDGNAGMHVMHYSPYQNGSEMETQDDGDESEDEGLGKSPVLTKISFTYSVTGLFDIEQ